MQESPTPSAFVQTAGQQTTRSAEDSDKSIVDSDLGDVGNEAGWVKARAALEETAATAAQTEAAAAAMELEQTEIAAAPASQADGKSRPLKGGAWRTRQRATPQKRARRTRQRET